jgi:hypothetical protein
VAEWADLQNRYAKLRYGGEKQLLLSCSGKSLNVRITSEHGQEWSVDGEQAE